ncbi:MAG TPA: copper chaperone PCu(A)C [Steroidobacteraceae bacterium]|nr:copper chaperone PCu(A)C [Steroidobacteraceae bacterium]
MSRRFFPLFVLACALPVAAHRYELGPLLIEHPWTRPAPPAMSMGVAYLTITNHGADEERLVGASTPAAESVQFHKTTIVDGMARMRPMSEVVIPPGATVRIEPGGIHLMLVMLKTGIEAGSKVPLTLEFLHAGKITVQLAVDAQDGT